MAACTRPTQDQVSKNKQTKNSTEWKGVHEHPPSLNEELLTVDFSGKKGSCHKGCGPSIHVLQWVAPRADTFEYF